MGYGLIATPPGMHDASRHVVGTVYTAVRTSCNPPLWSISNILLEQPLMRELVHRCDSHRYLHGAQP